MPPETSKLLWDMRNAAERILEFTNGRSYADYLADELLRSGVERKFEIIGEAMTRLIKVDIDVAHGISDHRKISRFRNALIHGYDSINDEISWGIVVNKLPVLLAELKELMK